MKERHTLFSAPILDEPLQFLIAQATALAGGNTCAAGHDWQSDAARRCPHGAEECSQAAYQCKRCGEYDYGYRGGPGYEDCRDGSCSTEAYNIVHHGAVAYG